MWYLLMLINGAVPLDVFTTASVQLLGIYLHCIPNICVPSGGMCYLVIKAVSVDYYILGIITRLSHGECSHVWSPLSTT